MLRVPEASRNPSPQVTQVLGTVRWSSRSLADLNIRHPELSFEMSFDSPYGVTWRKLLQGMESRDGFKRVREVTKGYVG